MVTPAPVKNPKGGNVKNSSGDNKADLNFLMGDNPPWTNDYHLAVRSKQAEGHSALDAIASLRNMQDYGSKYISAAQANIDEIMVGIAQNNVFASVIGEIYHALGQYAIDPQNPLERVVGNLAANLVSKNSAFAFTMGVSNGFFSSIYGKDAKSLDLLTCVGGDERVRELELEPAAIRKEISDHKKIYGTGLFLGEKIASSLMSKNYNVSSLIDPIYG